MNKQKTLLILILMLYLALRLPNLEESPKWYWDEGVNLDYSNNLLNGHVRWSCIDYAWIPHPPLYYMILSAIIKIFGYSLYPIRVFNVLLGLITLLTLFKVGKLLKDETLGLTIASLYTIYPAAIYWSKMAFNNNLLATLITLSFYFFLKNLKEKKLNWDLATLFMGLAVITEIIAVPLTLSLIGYAIIIGGNRLKKALIYCITPTLLVYLPILILKKEILVKDTIYQLNRFHILNPKIGLILLVLPFIYKYRRKLKEILVQTLESESEIMFNLEWIILKTRYVPIVLIIIHLFLSTTTIVEIKEVKLFSGGDYFWMGILGMLFMNSFYMNTAVYIYFLPLFTTLILLGRSDHMLIPIYPLFSVGVGILITFLVNYCRNEIFQKLRKYKNIIAFIVILPFIILVFRDIEFFMIEGKISKTDISEMQNTANYLNDRVQAQDVVLTTSHIIRKIKGKTFLFPQAIVYEGCDIMTYTPKYMPKSRFIGDCQLENARYLVTETGNMKWIKNKNCENVVNILKDWQLVYEQGRFEVYENPEVLR